jgi:hypothetical protein
VPWRGGRGRVRSRTQRGFRRTEGTARADVIDRSPSSRYARTMTGTIQGHDHRARSGRIARSIRGADTFWPGACKFPEHFTLLCRTSDTPLGEGSLQRARRTPRAPSPRPARLAPAVETHSVPTAQQTVRRGHDASRGAPSFGGVPGGHRAPVTRRSRPARPVLTARHVSERPVSQTTFRSLSSSSKPLNVARRRPATGAVGLVVSRDGRASSDSSLLGTRRAPLPAVVWRLRRERPLHRHSW